MPALRPLLSALAFAALSFAQAPGTTDSEGNFYWPNGRGRNPLNRQGVWKTERLASPGGNLDRLPAATPAETQSITSAMDALAALLKATPEASALHGYWIKEARNLLYPVRSLLPPELPAARAPLAFETGIYPFPLEDILQNGAYVPFWGQETESVYFRFNELPGPVGRKTLLELKRPNGSSQIIYLRPRVTATFRNLPVLEGDLLLIARPGRDPWAPVPYGPALRAALPLLEKDRADAERRLASLRKTHDETQAPAYEAQLRAQFEKNYASLKTTRPDRYQTRLESLERELRYNRDRAARQATPQRGDPEAAWYWNPLSALEDAQRKLAALSPADAAAPACFLEAVKDAATGRYSLPGSLEIAPGPPGCEPLASDNFAYFDPKASRAEPQILLLKSLGRCARVQDGALLPLRRPTPGKVSHGCERHAVIWQQLDWARLAAIVRR